MNLFVGGLSFGLSVLFCRLVMMSGVVDAPDGGRKTQKSAIPTLGGIGIFAAALAVMLIKLYRELPVSICEFEHLLGPIAFVLASFLVGFVDDQRPLGAKLKMGILLGFSIVGAAFGTYPDEMWLPGIGMVALHPIIGVFGAALWLFVVVNAVNFMDGANGIAMGSSAIMLGCFGLLLGFVSVMSVGLGWHLSWQVGLSFSLLGFLVWNLQGRLYAGDCGSLLVGASLGIAGLIVAEYFGVWIAALILLPFLADVFLTLIWRAKRGRKLTEAHRDHAYQLFLRAGWPHWKVALLWWGFTLAVCGAAYYADARNRFTAFCVALAISIALWMWQRITLGRRLQHDGQ